MQDLRIIFMGTPDFAVHTLDAIVNAGHNVIGVITAPDKPAGRGKKINESAVKKYALEKGLNILQPKNLKDPEFINELRSLNADLQIVVAFRMLPEIVWAMPPKGTFNLHASLLPQYRGAAPINWAVINGETKTGVSCFFLDKEIDTGHVIMQEEVDIDSDETAGSLHDKMMHEGAKLVVKCISDIAKGEISSIPQSDLINEELKHAPKIFKDDCKIDWSENRIKVKNFIHGLSPYPAAFCQLIDPEGETYNLKIFKVTESNISEPLSKAGTIVLSQKNHLKVACSDGFLNILELQLAGKRKMSTEDFLKGFRLNSDWKLA